MYTVQVVGIYVCVHVWYVYFLFSVLLHMTCTTGVCTHTHLNVIKLPFGAQVYRVPVLRTTSVEKIFFYVLRFVRVQSIKSFQFQYLYHTGVSDTCVQTHMNTPIYHVSTTN